MPLKTASVEILEDMYGTYTCDICVSFDGRKKSVASFNVFDGNTPKYACGNHLSMAVRRVATRKGG